MIEGAIGFLRKPMLQCQKVYQKIRRNLTYNLHVYRYWINQPCQKQCQQAYFILRLS